MTWTVKLNNFNNNFKVVQGTSWGGGVGLPLLCVSFKMLYIWFQRTDNGKILKSIDLEGEGLEKYFEEPLMRYMFKVFKNVYNYMYVTHTRTCTCTYTCTCIQYSRERISSNILHSKICIQKYFCVYAMQILNSNYWFCALNFWFKIFD